MLTRKQFAETILTIESLVEMLQKECEAGRLNLEVKEIADAHYRLGNMIYEMKELKKEVMF